MTGFSAPDKSDIAGYDFGSANSARSPVSAEELLQLEQTLGYDTKESNALGEQYEHHLAFARYLSSEMTRASVPVRAPLRSWRASERPCTTNEYGRAPHCCRGGVPRSPEASQNDGDHDSDST